MNESFKLSQLKKWIPLQLHPALRRCRDWGQSSFAPTAYEKRIQREIEFYSKCAQPVHELPKIAGYWVNTHIAPMMEPFGFTNAIEFFRTYIGQACRDNPNETVRCLSVGAGDCAPEINIVQWLLENDIRNVHFDCVDLNPEVLERARVAADRNEVHPYFTFSSFDINKWKPHEEYRFVLAIQSLHHFVELEILFDKILGALHPEGYFLTDDMIGRNGHQRWPEALTIVQRLWAELPDRYKQNHSLSRLEMEFDNWDCSKDGFEGIRAQDILPLLVKRFHFDFFFAFGNVIDIFIDRTFGPNFDIQNEWDRTFIDRVHGIDTEGIESGRLKPTHIMAAMTRKSVSHARVHKNLTPEFCIRWP